MFNLLPEQQKKNLDKEYRLRKYYIIGCFAASTMLAALIFLLPSYISAKIALNAATTEQSDLQKTVGAQADVSVSALHELKTETDALATATSTPLSSLIRSVIADATANVHIKEMVYEAQPSPSIVLSGVAGTRDELLAFSNSLNKDTAFSSANLPVDDLAADKNSSFSITLMLK
jgi:hypothetical protein